MKLELFSEPFHTYGGLSGEGSRRVLGKPNLDPLAVLVRETVQNSWDARIGDSPVDFAIAGRRLVGETADALRDVFEATPPKGMELRQVLASDAIDILIVSDRGTTGLTGPLRADVASGRKTDFVDLVFNLGQPRDKTGGGGTYGFGKTIAYVVSRANTALVHTRTRVGTGFETRMIGIALGDHFEHRKKRFTGRHWWGRTNKQVIGPVLNSEADETARELELPPFGVAETGLTWAIIAPEFGGRDPVDALALMAETLAWFFWPKIVGVAPGDPPPMKFTVSWDGEILPIPDPERVSPLAGYVEAWRDVKRVERKQDAISSQVFPIRSQRPNKQLGLLAIKHMAAGPAETAPAVEDEAETPLPIPGRQSHHVALMRRVELIVKYLPGPEPPIGGMEWAGVFVCDKAVDDSFAEAEPPTHDDWQAAMVEDRHAKRHVRIAIRDVTSELRRLFAVSSGQPEPTGETTVLVANALGALLGGTPGMGPWKSGRQITSFHEWQAGTGEHGVTPGSPGSSEQGSGETQRPPKSRSRQSLIDRIESIVSAVGAGPGLLVRVRLKDSTEAVRLTVSARPWVDDGAAETDPPANAPMAEVVGWATDQGTRVAGPAVVVQGDDPRTWMAGIANPGRLALQIEVTDSAI